MRDGNYILLYKVNWFIDKAIDVLSRMICTSNHMFGRAVWDKLLSPILKILKLLEKNEGYFKVLKNHEGGLSQESL